MPTLYTIAESESAQAEVERKTYQKLRGHYDRLEKVLSESAGDWYLGQRSMADTFLYVLERWIEQTPLSIDDYPALRRHRVRMEQDDGVRKALQRQGMEPVG